MHHAPRTLFVGAALLACLPVFLGAQNPPSSSQAAAIGYLQREIKLHPVPVPPAPAYPNKAKP